MTLVERIECKINSKYKDLSQGILVIYKMTLNFRKPENSSLLR